MMHTVRRLGLKERSGCRYRSTSYLERRRREANKKEFIPIPDDTDLFLAFPNERLGNHYKLNWTLSGYGCPPLGHNAFYNLHDRHLKMYCDGELGPKKEIVCKREGPSSKRYFVKDGYTEYNFASLPTIDANEWRKLMLDMTTHIADSLNIFMTDCTIGSRGSEVRVRVISSDANTSLFLKNLYHPTTSNQSALDEHKPHIVVYHDPYFVASQDGLGVDSNPFSVSMLMSGAAALDNTNEQSLARISDTEKQRIASQVAGILLVGGTDSLTELQSSLTQLASYFHHQQQAVPLNASVVGTNEAQVLVHDPSGFLTSKGPNPLLLAQGCLWSSHGVYSAHRGITHQDAASADSGSLVWTQGTKKFVTQSQSSFTTSKQPVAIVRLVETGPAVAKGGSLDGLSVLPASFPFQTEFGFKDFAASAASLPVYSINVHSKDTKDVNSVLKQIAEGTFVLNQSSQQKPAKE